MEQYTEIGCETYQQALDRSVFEYMASILN